MLRVISASIQLSFLVGTLSVPSNASEPRAAITVHNQDEYANAAADLKPGDKVILANGEWRDFEIVFTGIGTPDRPITLVGETPGRVHITGRSNLRISGANIVVSGLVFRGGYSPTGEVISFRTSKADLATDSRITQVVIDRFNQPDRLQTDYWVAMSGKRNRFDHSNLIGKTNAGVTLAVILDEAGSRENGHRIDHNYFGPRPVLGSNGGETIRVGTSAHSMYDSSSVIENNVFDRCNGEVEIISIKSGANIVRGNLFLESRGSLTLRHGDGNLVERNVFLGKGVEHTGGIRVINRNQTVRGNYLEGIAGDGFTSALAVMNGVPDSPINRYVQVQNALIENNTIVASTRLTLGAGADPERSAPPIGSSFRRNLFMFDEVGSRILIESSTSGIAFSENRIVALPPLPKIEGVSEHPVPTQRASNGLRYPTDKKLMNVGAPRDLTPVSIDEVGASWYPKPKPNRTFGGGASIPVSPGENSLGKAVDRAKDGDRLRLAEGSYLVDRTLQVNKSISIEGSQTGGGSVIRFSRPSLFEIAVGGNLRLMEVAIHGSEAPDAVGNAVIRTSTSPMPAGFEIEFEGVHVRGLSINKAFDVIFLSRGSLADKITIANSRFEDITGGVLVADAETDDLGRYNADYVTITNSEFSNVTNPVVTLYRGGSDESTFGPHLLFADNRILRCGQVDRRGGAASLALHGVQHASIERSRFEESAALRIVHTTGDPVTRIYSNTFKATPDPIVTERIAKGPVRVMMRDNTFDRSIP
jgi:poly(beta-D-mannuronate) lyase